MSAAEQQHGGGDLVLRPVRETGAHRCGEAELDDAETARGDGHGREQPDEREGGEDLLPADLGVGHADVAEGDEEHGEQREVADQRRHRDPESTAAPAGR